MTIGVVIALLSAMSLIVGIVGGCIGAFFTMKVGVVRLETWRDIVDGQLTAAQRDIGMLRDDSLVHDMEIGDVMRQLSIARISRQRVR